MPKKKKKDHSFSLVFFFSEGAAAEALPEGLFLVSVLWAIATYEAIFI